MGLSTYENVLLAIIMVTQKWRSYLLGHHFILKTDHEALKYLMEQKISTNLHQKWLSKLLGYDYSVIYKRGKENHAADALSRQFEQEVVCAVVNYIKPTWKEELKASLVNDEVAQQIITSMAINPSSAVGYSYINGELKKCGKYYVGSSTDLRKNICSTIHSNMEGGHSGITASIKRAERLFYWPNLKKDFTQFIKECVTCQRNKPEHNASPGLLQPVEIPSQI